MQFSAYTYLYVEDDPPSRLAMQAIFERVLRVDTLTVFEDSTDFLPRVNSLTAKPDLFLLDIQMDPHDGFTMLNMLRGSHTYADATVVALTASVMNEEIDRLKAAGFNSVISKPLIVSEFPRLIENILKGDEIWHVAGQF